jgi:hypothetical protein
MISNNEISELYPNQKIEHKGDLTIKGNLRKGSQVTVTDGSLTILGNVNRNVQIKLILSKKKINPLMDEMLITGGGLRAGDDIYCDYTTKGGNKSMVGNVNINDRIFTDNTVTQTEQGYLITKKLKNSILSMNYSKRVAAQIDGTMYYGHEILVDANYNVTVDGKSTALKLIIKGNLGIGVQINSDVPIEIQGKRKNFCIIKDQNGSFSLSTTEKGSKVQPKKLIKEKNILKANSMPPMDKISVVDLEGYGGYEDREFDDYRKLERYRLSNFFHHLEQKPQTLNDSNNNSPHSP